MEEYRLPGDAALAYKDFTSHQAEQAPSAAAAVELRNSLSLYDREDLDRYTAWPRALVYDNRGAVSGLLMPIIPQDFFWQLLGPDSGTMESRPREMQWLMATPAQREAGGIDLRDVTRAERLTLLAQLVRTIALLHKHGWVFGDISSRNIAFKLDPSQIMLLDCDGAAPLSDLLRQQASTPFWEPPELSWSSPGQHSGQNLQDDVTDVYKLGLAILRILTPGKGVSRARDPARLTGQLDLEGIGLVTRALSVDRSARPSAQELYDYLDRTVSMRSG